MDSKGGGILELEIVPIPTARRARRVRSLAPAPAPATTREHGISDEKAKFTIAVEDVAKPGQPADSATLELRRFMDVWCDLGGLRVVVSPGRRGCWSINIVKGLAASSR